MRVSSRNEFSLGSKEKPLALNFGLTWLLVLLAVGVFGCGPATSTATATLAPSPPVDTPVEEAATDAYADARQRMVQYQLRGRDITNEAVLAAMAQVPRHEFVPADYRPEAYGDYPLPIGYGQTISQPYIVAVMTELVDIQPGEKVLEIGTGSGYQAAILAQLTDQVYTIEIIPELAQTAQATFNRLGYTQIVAKQADGYGGWEDYAPFDAILVTAAPDHVPQPLVNQLADGGKMVIPIGPPGGYQSLWLLERQGDEVTRTNWGGVRFVPLTRSE
ncbi:MAG: protein-L-isoaspartate(D-aspartate) O-methyltransferase [Anaerolineae bacterium]|nr:protein-L-isoaspartate(D-aspartate) O-methyltransferase [Anaerolineae bacterium]